MTAFDYSQMPQQTYQSITSTAPSYSAMVAQLGKEIDFPDADNIVGQNPVTYNANYRRRCVLVQNNPAGSALNPGAPLQFTAGATNWGIIVDACPQGSSGRLVAPGYVNGASTNTIPVGAFFWAVKNGPTSVLSDGTLIAAGDNLTVGATTGSAKTNYGLAGGEVFSAVAPSTVLTNTTVATKFDQNYTFVAKSLNAGDTIRVRAEVAVPSGNSTDTLAVDLMLGTQVIASVAAFDPTNGGGDVVYFDLDIEIRTSGASGTMVATGVYGKNVNGTTTNLDLALLSTAIDTTAAQQLAVRGTWSVANAGDQARLDVLNISKINVNGTTTIGTAIAGAAAGSAVLFRAQVNCAW